MIFRNEYWFLSNMFPCSVMWQGDVYKCSEAAYQAAKCADIQERKRFTNLDGFAAKRLGRQVKLRPDWPQVQIDVMRDVLTCKFNQNNALLNKLKQVKGIITEDNHWNDTFWGMCRGVGNNHLGKLLMKIRDEN